jgi:hypothetical protein
LQPGDGRPAASGGVAAVVRVATAIRRELRALEAAGWPEGAQLLVLARMLDDPGTADTARPAAARELRETLAMLRARAAAAPRADRLDELAAARGTRRSA